MRRPGMLIAFFLSWSFRQENALADARVSKSAATPVEIARAPNATCDLLADEQFLFWTTVDSDFERPKREVWKAGSGGAAIDWRYERATIQRLPKAGGVPITFAAIRGDRLSELRLDQGHLYWNGQHHNDLWRIPRAGGPPVRLDDGKTPLYGTILDSEYLYARNQNKQPPTGVVRVPKTGGASTAVVKSESLAVVVGVDRDSIFWSERIEGGATTSRWVLKMAPRAGGAAKTVRGIDELPSELLFSDEIYFMTEHAAYRMNRVTLKAEVLAQADDYGMGAITIDGDYLYWADVKAIKKVPRRGGAVAVVVTGGEICAVVVDRNEMFWIDRGGNRDAYKVMKITLIAD